MKKSLFHSLFYIVSASVVLALSFVWHRDVVFMMDDLWYSTNLATGEPLRTASDVFSGQLWHYFNWGGRSVTHTLLQFIIMRGELFADLLNVCVQAFLAFICSLFINKENRLSFTCLTVTLMIVLNRGLFYSMFWQSGSVNYLYSTCWIAFFAYVYMRKVNDEEDLFGASFWMVPLGLITGWSNENMGPASCCLAVMTILYVFKKKKSKSAVKLWMIEGAVSSFVGSILVILAPGNFVRSEFTSKGTLTEVIRDRFMSMLTGGAGYLMPSFALLVLLYVIASKFCKEKTGADEIILFITAFLAYSAMILSPHFPDRAAFGIMIFNIILINRQIEKISGKHKDFVKYKNAFYAMSVLMSVAIILVSVAAY